MGSGERAVIWGDWPTATTTTTTTATVLSHCKLSTFRYTVPFYSRYSALPSSCRNTHSHHAEAFPLAGVRLSVMGDFFHLVLPANEGFSESTSVLCSSALPAADAQGFQNRSLMRVICGRAGRHHCVMCVSPPAVFHFLLCLMC